MKLAEFRPLLIEEGNSGKYVYRHTNAVITVFGHAFAGEFLDTRSWIGFEPPNRSARARRRRTA